MKIVNRCIRMFICCTMLLIALAPQWAGAQQWTGPNYDTYTSKGLTNRVNGTSAYGVWIQDTLDGTSETMPAPSYPLHTGIEVDLNSTLDNKPQILAGVLAKVRDGSTNTQSNTNIFYGGNFETGMDFSRANQSYPNVDLLCGVMGAAGPLDPLDPNPWEKRVLGPIDLEIGGDFYAYVDAFQGGDPTRPTTITTAIGVSGQTVFDGQALRAVGNPTTATVSGAVVPNAYGGKFNAGIKSRYDTSGAAQFGKIVMGNVYGVNTTVEMADSAVTTQTGQMTNAYALYAEVKDPGNHISGDKYAIYAKGNSKVEGNLTVTGTITGNVNNTAKAPFRFERAGAIPIPYMYAQLYYGPSPNVSSMMPWSGKIAGWNANYTVTANSGGYPLNVAIKYNSTSREFASVTSAVGTYDAYGSMDESFSAGTEIGAEFWGGSGEVDLSNATITVFVVFD